MWQNISNSLTKCNRNSYFKTKVDKQEQTLFMTRDNIIQMFTPVIGDFHWELSDKHPLSNNEIFFLFFPVSMMHLLN